MRKGRAHKVALRGRGRLCYRHANERTGETDMTAPRPLVAGNWKMNGLKAGLAEIDAIRDAAKAGGAGRAEVAICPPFTLVAAAA